MKRTRILVSALIMALLLALLWVAGTSISQAAPAATTWYVDAATGDDNDDCLTPGTACATIGAAVGKAASGDTVEIAAGTYNEHDIEVYDELTLNGAGMENTIVDAGAAGRVFRVGSTVVISNLRLQNGQTSAGDIFDEGGGAVLTTGSAHLTLQSFAGSARIRRRLTLVA